MSIELLSATRVLFRAGYAPAGQLLFLACPSKSNQKERHPAYRPLRGFPALLTMPGGCGKRSFVPVWAQKVGVPLWETRASRSDSPRRLPPAWLRYSAVRRGPENQVNTGAVSARCKYGFSFEKAGSE